MKVVIITMEVASDYGGLSVPNLYLILQTATGLAGTLVSTVTLWSLP
jgi:hypothetical protein